MIWNVIESVNPWYRKPAPTTPFWFWIYDENHTKLYKFGGGEEIEEKKIN